MPEDTQPNSAFNTDQASEGQGDENGVVAKAPLFWGHRIVPKSQARGVPSSGPASWWSAALITAQLGVSRLQPLRPHLPHPFFLQPSQLTGTCVHRVLSGFNEWFWQHRFWLPPNVTWAELEDRDGRVYPHPQDMLAAPPLALVLLAMRLAFER